MTSGNHTIFKLKDMFPGNYRPTNGDFKEMWENCVFVLDSNVLLNLYEYSCETSEELQKIFKYISDADRLWIPHQSALEYHRNRVGVVVKKTSEYKKLISSLREIKKQFQNKLNDFSKKYHPMSMWHE